MNKTSHLFPILSLLLSLCFLSGCMTVSDVPHTTTMDIVSSTATQCTIPTQLPTVHPTEVATQAPTELQTEPPTSQPLTEPPTEPQPTVPADIPDEYIGTLYTRKQLESIDGQARSFGPGRYHSTVRPPNPVQYQKEFSQYNTAFIGEDTPTVYLTFDCGYEYNNLTADILDILKEKNIKAVFFVTMHYCKSQPQLVRRMIDEGHAIGNHTSNHPNMPTVSIDTMVYEIMSLHEYVKTNFGYEMTFFRPPSGRYSPRVLAVAQSLGYKTVFWSFAYRDWETDNQPDSEEAFYTITSCAHNGCIYLLHAVSNTNASILGSVIDDLVGRGYTIGEFQ